MFDFSLGFDGGQRQWFIMEIFDQQTNVLQANISSKYPVFTVNGLDSGKLLKIIIYAINVKGRSDSVMLEAYTLKAAEKQTGKLCHITIFFICIFSISFYFTVNHKRSEIFFDFFFRELFSLSLLYVFLLKLKIVFIFFSFYFFFIIINIDSWLR